MPDKGKRGPSQQKLVKPRRGQKVQAIRSGSGTGRSSSVDGTEIKPRRSGLDPINHRRAADSAKMPQATKGLSDAEENHMLYTIALVLGVLWLLGLVTGYTAGYYIHILLVIAVARW